MEGFGDLGRKAIGATIGIVIFCICFMVIMQFLPFLPSEGPLMILGRFVLPIVLLLSLLLAVIEIFLSDYL